MPEGDVTTLKTERIYLTKEVGEILDISVPSVRNYAKALERSGYEFKKRKQARLWTDYELELIKEVLNLYNNNDYALDICFQYVVTKHTEGEEEAEKILQSIPTVTHEEAINMPYHALFKDIQAIKDGIEHIQVKVSEPEQIEHNNQYEKENVDLKKDKAELEQELLELNKEHEALKEELNALKKMGVFEFMKYRKQ